ncbi:MAG: pilB, partial [Phycisphaerales bacterium]|nr:pilB [Phycisphaerales bacterium]
MAKQPKKLGELLVEWGACSPKDVAKALEHAKKQSMRIGEALIDLKLVNETAVFKALASQHNMEYVDLEKSSIPPNAIGLIPDDLMRKYVILPLGKENGRLRVVVHDPLDLEMLDILRFRLHADIRTVLAPRSRIKSIIDELFQTTAANTIDKTVDSSIDKLRKSLDATMDKSVDRSIDKSIDLAGIGEEGASDPTQAPIIKLVQAMIAEAVRNRASDIHIEPMKDRVRVRYRIDGECVDRDRIPLRMKNPLISRLKIMAGIDIAEKRLPQDGRIKLTVDKSNIDFRVS